MAFILRFLLDVCCRHWWGIEQASERTSSPPPLDYMSPTVVNKEMRSYHSSRA